MTDVVPHLPVTVAPERCFDAQYGLEIVDDGSTDDCLRGRVAVRPGIAQAAGFVHGGVLAAVAEALASQGTFRAVAPEGLVAMGQFNQTDFLRPFTAGHVHAVACPSDRGADSWLWDVELRDDEGRLCAVSRVRIAVRAPRAA